jgi:hypothetical protein
MTDAPPPEHFEKLSELQYPIDVRITNELIMSTPDTWKAIRLEVEVIWHPSHLELGYTITSPEGRDASKAKPTDALKKAVEEMVRLHKQFGHDLKRVISTATEDAEGWEMNSTYE